MENIYTEEEMVNPIPNKIVGPIPYSLNADEPGTLTLDHIKQEIPEYSDFQKVYKDLDNAFHCPVVEIKEELVSSDYLYNKDIETLERNEAIAGAETIGENDLFLEWNLKSEEIQIKEEHEDELNNKSVTDNTVEQEVKYETPEPAKKTYTFSCDQCPYQTNKKYCLKVHRLRHEDPGKVARFRCTECDYETIYKSRFTDHLAQPHKNPDEMKVFKCDKCDYQTVKPSHLRLHLYGHKNPGNVGTFKCRDCDYETIFNQCLKRHVQRRHATGEVPVKFPKQVRMIACCQCDYQSNNREYYRRHFRRRHAKANGVVELECDLCRFRTTDNESLKDNILRHIDHSGL